MYPRFSQSCYTNRLKSKAAFAWIGCRRVVRAACCATFSPQRAAICRNMPHDEEPISANRARGQILHMI